jgi:GTPase involved in cell partitioning and DNA repair
LTINAQGGSGGYTEAEYYGAGAGRGGDGGDGGDARLLAGGNIESLTVPA